VWHGEKHQSSKKVTASRDDKKERVVARGKRLLNRTALADSDYKAVVGL
jgi:hypothetical protein